MGWMGNGVFLSSEPLVQRFVVWGMEDGNISIMT
jgi:hypothetical protein